MNGEHNMAEGVVAVEEKFVITRKQFEKLREVFDMYDTVDHIVWKQSSPSGIGPSVTIEFDPRETVKMDITDIESW
jgi:hypothetical protein